MRNAFVIFHPGRKLISCDFSEMLPVGAGIAASRLREKERETDRLMMWWGLFSFDASIAERSGLIEVGWGRARAWKSWKWRKLQCGRPVANSGPCSWRPRMYCVVIWCYCWKAMKNYHQLALNASLDVTTFPRWNQSLMGAAKRSVNVCWRWGGFKSISIVKDSSNELFC